MAKWKVADARVDINPAAAREILNSPGVKADLIGRAQRIVNSADTFGSGRYSFFESNAMYDNRFAVTVYPVGYGSYVSNTKHNTLLKALNAGR